MADELIFRIGFDLEAGVKEAMKDGDLALGRIEKALAKKPIIVKMRLDQQERLSGQVKSESKKAASALSGLKKEMAELNRQWNTLTASERGGEAGAKLMAQYRALSEESKGYMTTLNAAVKLEDKLARQRGKSADAAQKAAQKTREYSDELKNQDGYISRLLKRMAVYAGYSMATNFLTSIREVTAQFELQRISLGAIIQDQQKANQIFAEIKSFALTSPLKILDLTKYTKQVSAYGFETEKLFDTTKMLADISVGLGVDFGRTVLAYSQVFTTGFLRASEARQMTEQGIPIVDKLAKKLTELNGRIYTAAEVMDMMSKRAISFELVEQVFKDMTSAGGEFYNMQVKQSQTLFGMWSKLGDAAAIMYDQIGNTSTVNAGMKTTMGLLESMMRNWKTTARVLDTVSVALAVYVIGLKNAAVASTAMTATEAARLAITNRQIIATPKLIASIIGQNAATKLSTTLTRAHTVAMLNQSAATNVLTRGFWKLTAAMLANPWVAAAAAIAAVGVALFHFIGNTETAAERAEKLNNSVASLKNLETTTGGLVETYNELSVKTERTAEEQKKLSEVTHELAKQYPGAITAVGNFGEEVELAADKLNKLYQAEKQARMSNTRYELEQTEKKIRETEAEIARLQGVLQKGTKTMTVGGGISGYVQTITVEMSDEDKGKVLQQIDELLYGEDGQGGLQSLKESAQAAKDALEAALKGISIEELHIERFGAWKKTLTTFRQQVGDIRVQLFDDSTINQFSSLEEALKKTAEEYKKNIALVATYDETLKSTSLTSEERAKIETERAEADAMANLAEKALKYYNAMSLLNTSTSGRGTKSDNRLQNLQEIERTLTSINKKYEELAKTEGNTAALEYVRKNYDSTLKYINKLGEQFNLNFAMPTDFKDLQSYRKAIQGVIEQLKMKGYEKAAIELELKIAEGNQAQLQKEIQAKLKDLADRISRTKTAKEFYEKILSQTGDVELAANLSLSIYGENGEDLDKAIRDNIQATLGKDKKGIDLDFSAAVRADGSVDYNALEKIAKGYLDMGDISEDTYNKILKMRDEDRKDLAKTVEGWLKATEKAKSYSDKLLDLRRKTQTEIDRINKEEARGRITPEVAENQRGGFLRKEAEEIAKLQYEAFKDSPMYVQMFDDLDHASTRMLENMKSRMEGFKEEWKNLTPTQLKEMQSRMNEIDSQLAKRNPFKTLTAAIKKYRDYTKKGEADGGTKSAKEADAKLADAANVADEARKKYDELVKKYGEGSEKSVQEVIDAKNELDKAMANEAVAQKAVENWKKVKDAIGLSANELFQMLNWAGDIAKGIADISEAMGADEEDVQYWNDVANALDQISGGIQDIVSAAMSGNVVGIISSTLTAIPKMFVGFTNLFSAGKIKKANKEIKRQQELLDQLEYTYGRLEKAAEKALGADYINNYNQQIKNLQAQQQAYLKQAEAERSKGKDEDEAKTQEYLNNARDIADKIADMQNNLAAQFLGGDIASVARDFASAWLDAYKEFGSVTDAMSKKFKEMIQQMVANSVIAQVMKRALQPTFDLINNMKSQDFYSEDFWSKVVAEAERGAEAGAHGAEVIAKMLEKSGIDLRDIGSEYTGIAKDVAGATSEEINAAAAIGNTIMYHTSHLPIISQNVAAMYQLMSQGKAAAIDSGSTGWTDWQTQAMAAYNATAKNTADMVVRCERAAVACEAMAEKMNRIIVARGGKFAVNTTYI